MTADVVPKDPHACPVWKAWLRSMGVTQKDFDEGRYGPRWVPVNPVPWYFAYTIWHRSKYALWQAKCCTFQWSPDGTRTYSKTGVQDFIPWLDQHVDQYMPF